jgi:hypothetical protein
MQKTFKIKELKRFSLNLKYRTTIKNYHKNYHKKLRKLILFRKQQKKEFYLFLMIAFLQKKISIIKYCV